MRERGMCAWQQGRERGGGGGGRWRGGGGVAGKVWRGVSAPTDEPLLLSGGLRRAR